LCLLCFSYYSFSLILFFFFSPADAAAGAPTWDVPAAPDSARLSSAGLRDWRESALSQSIRNRFVTGDWTTRGDGVAVAGVDDGAAAPEGDVYGDFEDLETGENFAAAEDGNDGNDDDEDSSAALARRKEAKKRAFDASFDSGHRTHGRVTRDGDADADDPLDKSVRGAQRPKPKPVLTKSERKSRKHKVKGGKKGELEDAEGSDDEDSEESSEFNFDPTSRLKKPDFYEVTKTEMERQRQVNLAEFADESAHNRALLEGHRPGRYVRLEIAGMPAEFINHFNPRTPLLLGGVLTTEHGLGMLQVRLKKHRWHKKILKTRDPLIVSLGWRRFQTMPLYAMRDPLGRHRVIKYTPEHMHCVALMYAPVTAPGAGMLAVQRLGNSLSDVFLFFLFLFFVFFEFVFGFLKVFELWFSHSLTLSIC
jgi:ribosome biogenesis protein BMS1